MSSDGTRKRKEPDTADVDLCEENKRVAREDEENDTPACTAMDSLAQTREVSGEELNHWNAMFFELMLYRANFGNVNVKSADEKHSELYKWIVQLRKDYKVRERDPLKSPLSAAQIKTLESVHFVFATPDEDHWQKNYERLQEYKSKHGHVLVHRQCDIPGLVNWVASQRQQYKEYVKGGSTHLTKQRKDLLDDIGLQWRIRTRPDWASKFEELVAYKAKYGDTRVPQYYSENRALGKWVAKQREQFKLMKKGKHSFLTPDRLEKLNSIGIVWSVRGETSTEWTSKFEELIAYKAKHGDTRVRQHDAENRALGKWVAKQREQFKSMKKGKRSLTPDRLEKLNSIGFVWNVRAKTMDDSPNPEFKTDEIQKADVHTDADDSSVRVKTMGDSPNPEFKFDEAKVQTEADNSSVSVKTMENSPNPELKTNESKKAGVQTEADNSSVRLNTIDDSPNPEVKTTEIKKAEVQTGADNSSVRVKTMYDTPNPEFKSVEIKKEEVRTEADNSITI